MAAFYVLTTRWSVRTPYTTSLDLISGAADGADRRRTSATHPPAAIRTLEPRLGVRHSVQPPGVDASVPPAAIVVAGPPPGLSPRHQRSAALVTVRPGTAISGGMAIHRSSQMVGLYRTPPQNAVVLFVDEKSQFRALDRQLWG